MRRAAWGPARPGDKIVDESLSVIRRQDRQNAVQLPIQSMRRRRCLVRPRLPVISLCDLFSGGLHGRSDRLAQLSRSSRPARTRSARVHPTRFALPNSAGDYEDGGRDAEMMVAARPGKIVGIAVIERNCNCGRRTAASRGATSWCRMGCAFRNTELLLELADLYKATRVAPRLRRDGTEAQHASAEVSAQKRRPSRSL